jgi:hypothetical protein
MYCPRCGSPNVDTTKFCRQCGLPLAQLTDYVASGGTAPLSQANLPNLAQPVTQSLEGMTPRQKMALTIIGMTMLIPFSGIVGEALFDAGEIAGLLSVLLPFGIIWAVFHFRNQARRLAQEQWQRQMQMNQMYAGAPMHSQPYLPPPVQPPIQQPAQPARPQAVLQPMSAPIYQIPLPSTPQEPPNTNPLGTAPSSVVEDETRRLSDKQS